MSHHHRHCIKQSKDIYGMTGREFKDRWREHKSDIKNIKNTKDKQKTRLSAHTSKLKDKNNDFDVKWRIVERASD
jgi:hypothetical protein